MCEQGGTRTGSTRGAFGLQFLEKIRSLMYFWAEFANKMIGERVFSLNKSIFLEFIFNTQNLFEESVK